MANDTQSERQATAESELDKKLRLEKPVAAQSRTILRNMANDLETTYAATGTVLDAENYRDDFVGVLRPAYRKTERIFGDNISPRLDADPEEEDPPFELLLLLLLAQRRGTTLENEISRFRTNKNQALLDFTNNAVPVRADLITATNQRELDRSVAKATAAIIEAGERPTRSQVATDAKKIFRDASLFRGNVIAATEIQNAAEGAKSIEAETFNNQVRELSDSGEATINRIKEWHTQGDEKVRPAHVQADLQAVGFDEAFIVGGERLRFPGDTSLGATAGNTINCRCSAIYFVDGSINRVVTARSDTGFLEI